MSFCLWCVYFCDGAGAVVEVGLQWWCGGVARMVGVANGCGVLVWGSPDV